MFLAVPASRHHYLKSKLIDKKDKDLRAKPTLPWHHRKVEIRYWVLEDQVMLMDAVYIKYSLKVPLWNHRRGWCVVNLCYLLRCRYERIRFLYLRVCFMKLELII
jgi:hypothetical protein